MPLFKGGVRHDHHKLDYLLMPAYVCYGARSAPGPPKQVKERSAMDISPDLFFVRKKDLPKLTGLKRCSIEDEIARGRFPPGFALTERGRAKGWRLSDIIKWQNERAAAANTTTTPTTTPTTTGL